jgi:hypothetical protein
MPAAPSGRFTAYLPFKRKFGRTLTTDEMSRMIKATNHKADELERRIRSSGASVRLTPTP